MSLSKPVGVLTHQTFGNLVFELVTSSVNNMRKELSTTKFNDLHEAVMQPLEKALEKQDSIVLDDKNRRLLESQIVESLHDKHFPVTKEAVAVGFDKFAKHQQPPVSVDKIQEEERLLYLANGGYPQPTTEALGEVDALMARLRPHKR